MNAFFEDYLEQREKAERSRKYAVFMAWKMEVAQKKLLANYLKEANYMGYERPEEREPLSELELRRDLASDFF